VVSGDEVEFGTVPPYLIYTAYRYFIACIGLPISSYYITVPVPKLRTHRIAFPVGTEDSIIYASKCQSEP